MKLFIDTANIDQIKRANSLGVLDGVTTNPTLLAKEGKDPRKQLEDICKIVKGPVSGEVTALDAESMVREAETLASIAKNIVIKVPVTEEGLKTTKSLCKKGIKTNLTLCFSPLQALLVAKAGATYVSPFIGRLDDISTEGMQLVDDIKDIYDNYNIATEIIVASVRHPVHILEAARIGADIATVPFKVIEKLIKHPLTDIGIKRFLDDWQALNENLNKK
jgi:transaldolase